MYMLIKHLINQVLYEYFQLKIDSSLKGLSYMREIIEC